MKKLLLIATMLISLGVVAQDKKDSTKKTVELPGPSVPPQKVFYLILPQDNWTKIITMLRKSTYPSNEIDDAITYIMNNAKELAPPAADSTKPKK